uniref:Uncharacterized protein n=1 Tax=candidate division CPR3 bacterium TaxID=2268181 RepID=A0A7V3N5S4_UNCC3
MKKEDLMAEVLSKVRSMVANGIDRNTISFYILTTVGGADLSGLEKVMFIGAVERALDNVLGKS